MTKFITAFSFLAFAPVSNGFHWLSPLSVTQAPMFDKHATGSGNHVFFRSLSDEMTQALGQPEVL